MGILADELIIWSEITNIFFLPGGQAVPQDQSPPSTCPPGPPGPPAGTNGSSDVMVNFDPDPADLALSSVPGQEAFDPRRHRFSEDELKPQPMIKKARKMLVPDEQKVLHLPQSFCFLYVQIHCREGFLKLFGERKCSAACCVSNLMASKIKIYP